MASLPNDSDEYVDSSGSDVARPNRWHGPPSTWQQMNCEEIDTLTALNEIRNRDLSVHLYNAFALKQRHRNPLNDNLPVPGQDINAVTGQTVQQDDWEPQRSWTAWPMGADKVPAPDFMKTSDEADETYTTKNAIAEMPSAALEETISAAILRIAKEKFERRPWQEDDSNDGNSDGELIDVESNGTDSPEDESDRSRTRLRSNSKSINKESDTKGESASKNLKPQNSDDKKELPEEIYLQPTVSTDDDISYALLRPSVQHILSKLDATLNVLHLLQESTMSYRSDSGDSDASDSSRASRPSSREGPHPGLKNKRGRPRSKGTPPASRISKPPSAAGDDQGKMTAQSSGLDEREGKKKTRRGRPKKMYERLQDESEREYAIRIARLQKRPIPTFSDLDSGAEAGRESDKEKVTSNPRPKRKPIKEPSPKRPGSKKIPKDGWKNHVGLRDWRNVLGAAALAGFPPQAVDRAARRCADLFGQSMVLHTLIEGPVGQRDPVKTTRYVPGMPQPPLLESDSEPPPKTRYRIRASSTAADPTSEGERGSSHGRSGSVSYNNNSNNNSMRGKYRSALVAGSYFCTFSDCPRAAEGFGRRQNLLRHLRLVHGLEGDELPVEVDSEDEMYGGVHVDEFLKPIKIRKGWRSNDVREEPRTRKRKRLGRHRKGSVSGTDGRRDLEGHTAESDAVGGQSDEW